MAEGITRVPEDSPERCQCVTSYGQCRNNRVEGGLNCIIHGGIKTKEKIEKASLRNYRIGKYQAALERQTDSPQVKSLREEIGILRMLIEERFNQIDTPTDLMLHTNAISDLIGKVERVVVSCHKLEGSMGQLMDKQALLQFASEIIGIIGEVVEDEEKIKLISDKIIAALSKDRANNGTPSEDSSS